MHKNRFQKVIVSFLLLLCLSVLGGCEKEEEIPTVGGYKPVVYYQGELYWLSFDKTLDALPDGYVDSSKTILSAEKDAYVLPSVECTTSAFNSGNVGATIYINKEDNRQIITSKDELMFNVFEKDQESQTIE